MSSNSTSGNTSVPYDLMGISANLIPNIKEGIDTYLENVMGFVSRINTTKTDLTQAFKGQAQVGIVQQYLSEATQVINNVTVGLREFYHALDQVQANYDEQLSNISLNSLTEENLNRSTGVSGFGD